MLGSGRHVWNAGVFLATAETFRTAFEALAPEVSVAVRAAVAEARTDLGFLRLGPSFAEAMEYFPEHEQYAIWFIEAAVSSAAEHEPAAYNVARDPATGELQGLCRCWRNDWSGRADGSFRWRRAGRMSAHGAASGPRCPRTRAVSHAWGPPAPTLATIRSSCRPKPTSR